MGISTAALIPQVQVNIPFSFLFSGYLEKFLARGLNPEIGLDGYSLDRYPPRAFGAVGRAFQQAGRRLTLHGPFQDMLPGALDDGVLAATRVRLRQACRYLPVFKPVALVCHLGYEDRHYGWNREDWLARAAATWQEIAAAAAAHGAMVMLENVYETDPEIFLEVLDPGARPQPQGLLRRGPPAGLQHRRLPPLAPDPGPGHRPVAPPRQSRRPRQPTRPWARAGCPCKWSWITWPGKSAAPWSPWSPTRKAA